jgi:glycosyltransferase involved in cell wall biosynthesis
MDPLKIAFVLSSRFPTEKAYGVTTRESLLALLDKKYEVRIFARQSNYMDVNYEEIKELITPLSENFLILNLFKIASFGKGLISRVGWRLGSYLSLNKSLMIIALFEPDVIWVREIEIVHKLITKFPKVKILLEVHTKPSKKKFLKVLKYRSQILFCPINENINKHLVTFLPNDANIQIAPMSINSNFVNTKSDVDKFVENLNKDSSRTVQIGYVGKFSPNGYSKGIEILFNLAVKIQSENLNFRVNLIGGDKSEIKRYTSLKDRLGLSDRYLFLQGHFPYFKVPSILRSMDVLVLPSPASNKYSGTPLKLYEYFVSGRIVMLADEEFIKQSKIETVTNWIFKPNDFEDLFTQINSAIHDPDLTSKIGSLIEFASNSTWEKRTTDLIQRIESI